MPEPKLLYQLTFENLWPTAVAFVDEGRKLAAGNQSGEIYLWELPESPPPLPEKKKEGDREQKAPDVPPVRKLEGHTNTVSRILFDRERKQLISSSFDHTVRTWKLDASPSGTTEAVLDLDSRRSRAKRNKSEVPLKAPGIKIDVSGPDRALAEHKDWIQALGMSGDGKRIITGDNSSQVIVWDIESGKPIGRWQGHPWNWIVAAALSQDGQMALVSEYRYKRDDFDIPTPGLKLWNVADGTEKLDLLKVQVPKIKVDDTSYGGAQAWRKFVADGLVSCAISPDGKLVAVGQGGETDTGKSHILETETGKLVRTISGHQYGMTALAFTKDGKLLVTAGRDTCVRLTEVESGKEVGVLGTPRGGQFKDWISAFSLSTDESHLAAADIGGNVAVWKL